VKSQPKHLRGQEYALEKDGRVYSVEMRGIYYVRIHQPDGTCRDALRSEGRALYRALLREGWKACDPKW
jgi:hypothetical protein